MSDEATNAAPDVTPPPPPTMVEKAGTPGLSHALYIFGATVIVVASIAAVVTVHNVMKQPKPKPAAQSMPAAVIVHEPAPVKEQDRVEVRPPVVVVEPDVPAVAEPEPVTPEAEPAPAAEPQVTIEETTPSATVPQRLRKRTHRPHPVVTDEPREVGFWASFMRAAARIAAGPSK